MVVARLRQPINVATFFNAIGQNIGATKDSESAEMVA
jgi:hypothetical protein